MLSEEFEEYLNAMYERAHKQFRESGEGRLLWEKVGNYESDCMGNFPSGDHTYITDLLMAQAEAEGAEAFRLYRQGYADCVETLRLLHVL